MGEKREKQQVIVEEEQEEDDVLLPGFRFHPTDEELIGFYLRRKVEKKAFSIDIIKEIDIYKHDPWDLPKDISAGEDRYYFCLRGRKYRNSIRPNRVTGSGFWKATGIDRSIYSTTHTGDCIGLKKSLVYYIGSAGKGTKTDWMMHEFRVPYNNADNSCPSMQEAEIWTICRIFKRNASYRKSPLNWRDKKNPNDSSSKTSSFESDDRNESRLLSSPSSPQFEVKFNSSYHEENHDQVYASQWNSVAQASITVLHSHVVPSPNVNDFSEDSNWDELGRVVEFMKDQNVASYYCNYT